MGVIWGRGALFEGGRCHLGVGGVVWGQGALFRGGWHCLCVCVHVVIAGCFCGHCSCVWMAGLSLSALGVCLYSFACLHLCLCHHGRWVMGAVIMGIDVDAGIIVIMGIVVVVVAIVVGVVVVVVAISISRCVMVVVVEEVVTVVTCHV